MKFSDENVPELESRVWFMETGSSHFEIRSGLVFGYLTLHHIPKNKQILVDITARDSTKMSNASMIPHGDNIKLYDVYDLHDTAKSVAEQLK